MCSICWISSCVNSNWFEILKLVSDIKTGQVWFLDMLYRSMINYEFFVSLDICGSVTFSHFNLLQNCSNNVDLAEMFLRKRRFRSFLCLDPLLSLVRKLGLCCFLMPLFIFQLYRGCQFLLVEETGVRRVNHQPAVSNWQTLSHDVSSTLRHERDSTSQC